ncbi:MAG: TetR/AcrR family transcriptional regulator [Roseiflexaceae bacterium]|nr:TetR/AcrR family transcriptional regulator [Roseiflexaceae bacterium]
MSESSMARERVLNVAEQLFSERGYNSVTLRDIADALGMKQSSLYNHAPGGKEELFTAVMERSMQRHKANIERVIAAAEPHLRPQLRAVARWLLSQPPVNLIRMTTSDLPSVAPDRALHIGTLGGDALFQPIMALIEQAYRRGETRMIEPGTFAATFLSLIDGAHHSAQYSPVPAEVVADDMIDLLLDGALRR